MINGRRPSIAGTHEVGRATQIDAALLEGVDLVENLLVVWKAMGDLVVVDDLPVDVHREDTAVSFFQAGGDAVFGLDGGLQTGGLGEVVSLAAIGDLDVHPFLLSDKRHPMIRAVVASVKPWPWSSVLC